jgi:hypothetical protein
MTKRATGELATVSFRIGIAFVIFVAAALVVLAYVAYPAIRVQLSFATAVLGGTSALYAAAYASLSAREALIQKRRDNAFALQQSFFQVDRAKVRMLIDKEIANKNISPAQLHEKILSDHDLLAGVSAILAQLEMLSIAVQQRYADEETLFYNLSFIVPWAYDGLRHYIQETRKLDAHPDLYIELEKLAVAWKGRKSLLSGKTFPPTRGRIISED